MVENYVLIIFDMGHMTCDTRQNFYYYFFFYLCSYPHISREAVSPVYWAFSFS